MGPFPRNWLAWFWSSTFKDWGTKTCPVNKNMFVVLWMPEVWFTSSRSPLSLALVQEDLIYACLQRLPHIFPPSERFLWPSTWQSARASVNLPWGQRWGHYITFFFFGGGVSLVIYSAWCRSGAKLFRFDPSTGQNEDYDLSSYSKSVTWLDDGVWVGWLDNGWMLGVVCGLFPKKRLENTRPKCGRFDFDIPIGGDILEQPLCLEPCQWNCVLQDPWVPAWIQVKIVTLKWSAISPFSLNSWFCGSSFQIHLSHHKTPIMPASSSTSMMAA